MLNRAAPSALSAYIRQSLLELLVNNSLLTTCTISDLRWFSARRFNVSSLLFLLSYSGGKHRIEYEMICKSLNVARVISPHSLILPLSV